MGWPKVCSGFSVTLTLQNPAFKAISQWAQIHLSNLIPNIPQLGHIKLFPWECIIISTLFTRCSLLRITPWFTPLRHCHFFPFDQRLSFILFIIHNVFLYEGLDSLLTNTVIMFYFDSFSSWGWINIPRTKVPFMFFKMPRGAYEWIVPFLSSMFTQKTILYSTHTLCLSFWSFLHHPTLAILKYSEIKSFTQRKNFHGPEFFKCSIFKENYLCFNLWYLKVWEVFFQIPPYHPPSGIEKRHNLENFEVGDYFTYSTTGICCLSIVS